MSKFIDMFTKKSFEIEIDNNFDYPTTATICAGIEKYCSQNNANLEYISKNPLTFRIDDTMYTTKITLSRGGYLLYCVEL